MKNSWAPLILCTLLFLAWFIPWVPKLVFQDSIFVTRLDAKAKPYLEEVGSKKDTWTPILLISRQVIHAVVSSEDGRYFEHFGIDPVEIIHSLRTNWQKKRYARGGSTITQQVVKMAFLSREKSIVRKSREIIGALVLESLTSKERILEWYLNLVEFGGGIYGIKRAGQVYFRTRPHLLTIEQAIMLASVLPNPNKWSAGLRKKSLTPFGQRRFLIIATRMLKQGFITKKQWHDALVRGNFGQPIAGYEAPPDPETIGDQQIEEWDDQEVSELVPSLPKDDTMPEDPPSSELPHDLSPSIPP